MALPGLSRLVKRSSDFGRFPTEGARRERSRRSHRGAAVVGRRRKEARKKQEPAPQRRAEGGGGRYGTQQSETGSSRTSGRGACHSGCSAERAVHPDTVLPDGGVRREWSALRKWHGRLLQHDQR